MTDEIKLGAEIPVNGMPAWLKDDEILAAKWCYGWYSGGTDRKDCYASPDDIIAIRLPADHPYYSRSDDTPVTITPMTVEEADAALYNIPTLRALGLIREDTTLERFEKAYGFMTTRERDTVGAFIEWQASFSA